MQIFGLSMNEDPTPNLNMQKSGLPMNENPIPKIQTIQKLEVGPGFKMKNFVIK